MRVTCEWGLHVGNLFVDGEFFGIGIRSRHPYGWEIHHWTGGRLRLLTVLRSSLSLEETIHNLLRAKRVERKEQRM